MIKPNSHLEKIVKSIATKKKQKPEDCLREILLNDYQKTFGKSYLI